MTAQHQEGRALANWFRGLLDFRTRAVAAEYWWPAFYVLVALFFSVSVLALPVSPWARSAARIVLYATVFIGPFLMLAVSMRRLHDTGWNGLLAIAATLALWAYAAVMCYISLSFDGSWPWAKNLYELSAIVRETPHQAIHHLSLTLAVLLSLATGIRCIFPSEPQDNQWGPYSRGDFGEDFT